MGEIYQIMKSNDCKVIGVAPRIYKDDFKMLQCDNEYTVDTTSERINLMVNMANIIIF